MYQKSTKISGQSGHSRYGARKWDWFKAKVTAVKDFTIVKKTVQRGIS